MKALITALSFFACISISQAKTEKIPLKDFFRNSEIAAFQISPSGEYLSYTKPYESRMNVYIKSRKTGEEKRITSLKDRDVSTYFWKESDHILYMRDFGGDENYHVFSVNIHTGVEKDLTPFPKVRASIIDDLEDVSKQDILVGLNKRTPELFDVYRLNITTGKMSMVAESPKNGVGWLADHNGKVRIVAISDGVNTKINYRETEQAKWETLVTTDYKSSFDPLLFTFDNKHIYASSNLPRDKASLVEFDPKTKKEVRILYQNPNYDTENVSYSRHSKKLWAAMYTGWKRERAFFDPEFEKIFNAIQNQFPESEISVNAHDRADRFFVFREYSDRSIGSYHLYDKKENRFEALGELAPWLKGKTLAKMQPIEYTSRDGLKIEGYLTLPPGKDPKSLPVIIHPHGGPWARDTWGFNPAVQWLANRGYAVLQMNFRGSTGFGKKFLEASFKEWGGKMQNDISDGVNWLIKEGIANPKKICIYGASYGGYATLAGLAFTPELYACGVDYVGVANLFTFMKTIPPYWKPMLEKLYAMVGHPETDKELLQARSPVFHVDKIRAPLFVAQGAKDPRVNKDESDQVVEALKKRGVKVEYMVKENEGHGFHNEENRFEFYEAMEKFLARYL